MKSLLRTLGVKERLAAIVLCGIAVFSLVLWTGALHILTVPLASANGNGSHGGGNGHHDWDDDDDDWDDGDCDEDNDCDDGDDGGGTENTKDLSWIYFVNGKSGEVAADKYELKNGDKVEWKYMKPNF